MRADQPATLTWVEALDGGDQYRNVQKRDRIFMQDIPSLGMQLSLLIWNIDIQELRGVKKVLLWRMNIGEQLGMGELGRLIQLKIQKS